METAQEPEVMPKSDGYHKGEKAQDELNLINDKYLKKYMFSIGAIGIALFVGGSLTTGIFAGVFTAAGFGLLLEKIREGSPSVYNWILDHPVAMDFFTGALFTFTFGFSVAGIIGGAVVNILTSVVLDYYAEKEGKVPGVETLTFGALFRKVLDGIKTFISGAKREISAAVKDIKKPQAEKSVVVVNDIPSTVVPTVA